MSCDDYLRDIGKIPLLTSDEEIILGNKVQAMVQLLEQKGISQQVSTGNMDEMLAGLDEKERRVIRGGIRARNRMVSANMRLVVAIAKKYVNKQVHMTMQDLIQEGAIGLTRAAEKFDPARGYKFSTYAYLWIRQGMTRGCESQEAIIKVPAHIQRTIRKASETRVRMSASLNREPTFQELAEEMGETDWKKLRDMIFMNPVVVSLDLSPKNGESSSLLEIVNGDDESEIKEQEEYSAKLDFIMMVVNALEDNDKDLIKQRYGLGTEPISVKDMAKKLGVAPQAIRERQQTITRKIRYVVTKFTAPAS